MNAKVGNTHGSGNKGKTKSEEHKRKIAEAIKRKYNEGHYKDSKPGRKKTRL